MTNLSSSPLSQLQHRRRYEIPPRPLRWALETPTARPTVGILRAPATLSLAQQPLPVHRLLLSSWSPVAPQGPAPASSRRAVLARLAALPSSVLPRASCLPLLRQAVVRATSTVVSPSRSLCTCYVGSLKPEMGQHVCNGGCEHQMRRHPLFAEVSLPLHLPDSWKLPYFTSTRLLPPFNRLSSLSSPTVMGGISSLLKAPVSLRT